jgi:hypothetical protein
MEKLERYLDQVCRSIGGPRSLRQHIRQELREHLRDAAAEHRAAGLSEEEALARALENFGGPEDVRSELEATHGHRAMAVLIDKAMQWKEMTMKAKWLWSTWAHLALACVVTLEALLITFLVIFIVPKFQLLLRHGMIDAAELERLGLMWIPAFLNSVNEVTGHYTTFILLGAAAAWGLFEWRVRSENKTFMRLSALGSAAVGLMAVIVLMAGSLVVAFTLAMPALERMARPWAVEQVTTIDTSINGLEQALARKDWGTMQAEAERASNAMNTLSAGPAISSLARWSEPPTIEELRTHVKAATEGLAEAQQAMREKDAGHVETAIQKFRKLYKPVREAAQRPAR